MKAHKAHLALLALLGGAVAMGDSASAQVVDSIGGGDSNQTDRRGIFIRSHGIALFNVPFFDNLSGYQLETSDNGGSREYQLTRDIGFGGGASVGYSFGKFYVSTGFDYIRQGFTTNTYETDDDGFVIDDGVYTTGSASQTGNINNYMLLAGLGIRMGGSLGFTIGADYGMNFIRINGLAGETNGEGTPATTGTAADDFVNDENSVGFTQHNIIGTLELDYTFNDFISVGAFTKYYYAMATENKSYRLGGSHALGAGASLSFIF
ncbi:MAG: hypothetical protein ACR2PV_09445 [Gammaproteobacteria bacterium]